jgi:TrmH family RNA methyltransferase
MSREINRDIELRIVLVRSIYERNVGATSRAMANMGFTKLILIGPQCEFTIEANKAAANGQYPFENKTVYKNWSDFYANEPRGLQIATTARDGRGRQVQDFSTTLNNFKTTSTELKKTSNEPFVIHILFGPEDWGLSAEDIQYANFCCSIPTYGDNTSLNLGQATLLAMHIYRSVFGGQKSNLEGQQKLKVMQKKPNDVFPDESLKLWLLEMGFRLDQKKMNVFTVLRRMLLQNAPSSKEFRVLEIVLQQSRRKLKELNDLKKEIKQ